MIRVEAVRTKEQLASFIDFPHSLYKDDKNYVPELFIAQRDLLTPGKHPFHEHSKIQPFLLYEDSAIKGRIAAILNKNHNEFNKVNEGFFGFFDCVDNQDFANRLFEEARKWLHANGAVNMIGPVNPSTNEHCGLLIEGFDRPPVVMMTYNKPYYIRLIEQAGFKKKIDLLAYHIETESADERSIRLQSALLERLRKKNITIRPINPKDFYNEVSKVKEVYNSAWDRNLGFVPMTDAEFKYMAKDMKLILDPKLCLVAEHEGRMVGFALAIPDLNQALSR